MRFVILLVALLVFLSGSVTLTAQPLGNSAMVDWHPDGTLLALASSDGNVYIYDDTSDLVYTLDAHEGKVIQAKWSPDGTLLATSAQGDNIVRIWDTATWSLLHELNHRTPLIWLEWKPDQTRVIVLGRDTYDVWDTINWQLEASSGIGGAYFVRWSSDGSLIGIAGTTHYYVLEEGPNAILYALTTEYANGNRVTAMDWHPDGTQIVTGTSSGSIGSREVSTLAEITTFETATDVIWELAYSPDGRMVAGALNNGEVWIWDAETGEVIQIVENPDVDFAISLSWNPASGELAYGYVGGPLNNEPNIISVPAEASED